MHKPKRQSPDHDQHGPRGRALFPRQTRTSTDQVAEPSFPGRPGPAPAKWQSLVTEWNVTPPGPVSGQCRWDGGLRRDQWSQTRGHKGRPGPARPGPAQTEGMKCEDKKSQKMVIVIDRDELTGAPVFSRRPRRETDDRPRTEDYYPSEKRPIYGYQNPNEKPNKFRSSSNSNNNNNNTEEEAAAAAPLKTTPSEVICKKTKVKRKSRRSGHLPAWEIQYKLALTHGLSTCAGRKAARAALKALGVVSLPAKGKKYNLEEALDQILKFPYNSSERGAVIKLLCEGGYAGIKKSQLYKCMKRANEKLKNETAIQH